MIPRVLFTYYHSLGKSEIISRKLGDGYLVISRGGNQHWFAILESPLLTLQPPSILMYGAAGMPFDIVESCFSVLEEYSNERRNCLNTQPSQSPMSGGVERSDVFAG